MGDNEVDTLVTAPEATPAADLREGLDWPRRLAGLAVFAAAGLALFAAYLRQARTVTVTPAGAANALQAWDMLHGNAMLRGWTVPEVSFYTTELPQYLLVELARGLNPDVVHIAAAISYTLMVLRRGAAGPGAGGGPRGRGADADRRRDHAGAVARAGQRRTAVGPRSRRHPGAAAGHLAPAGPGPAAGGGSRCWPPPAWPGSRSPIRWRWSKGSCRWWWCARSGCTAGAARCGRTGMSCPWRPGRSPRPGRPRPGWR